MRRKKKSMIPENAQVPVAIVMAIVFAIILAWRFWPKSELAPEPGESPVAIAVNESSEADVIRLRGLLSSLRREASEIPNTPQGAKYIVNNPFQLASWERIEEPEAFDDFASTTSPPEPVYAGPTREERLAMLSLTATVRQEGFQMAMVNGRYLRRGDEIDGFKVRAIHEKYILLRDEAGESKLQIAAPSFFDAVSVEIEPPAAREGRESN